MFVFVRMIVFVLLSNVSRGCWYVCLCLFVFCAAALVCCVL